MPREIDAFPRSLKLTHDPTKTLGVTRQQLKKGMNTFTSLNIADDAHILMLLGIIDGMTGWNLTACYTQIKQTEKAVDASLKAFGEALWQWIVRIANDIYTGDESDLVGALFGDDAKANYIYQHANPWGMKVYIEQAKQAYDNWDKLFTQLGLDDQTAIDLASWLTGVNTKATTAYGNWTTFLEQLGLDDDTAEAAATLLLGTKETAQEAYDNWDTVFTGVGLDDQTATDLSSWLTGVNTKATTAYQNWETFLESLGLDQETADAAATFLTGTHQTAQEAYNNWDTLFTGLGFDDKTAGTLSTWLTGVDSTATQAKSDATAAGSAASAAQSAADDANDVATQAKSTADAAQQNWTDFLEGLGLSDETASAAATLLTDADVTAQEAYENWDTVFTGLGFDDKTAATFSTWLTGVNDTATQAHSTASDAKSTADSADTKATNQGNWWDELMTSLGLSGTDKGSEVGGHVKAIGSTADSADTAASTQGNWWDDLMSTLGLSGTDKGSTVGGHVNSIGSTASDAKSTADSASSAANAAHDLASTAKATADSASSTASSAHTIATAAQSTATDADTKVDLNLNNIVAKLLGQQVSSQQGTDDAARALETTYRTLTGVAAQVQKWTTQHTGQNQSGKSMAVDFAAFPDTNTWNAMPFAGDYFDLTYSGSGSGYLEIQKGNAHWTGSGPRSAVARYVRDGGHTDTDYQLLQATITTIPNIGAKNFACVRMSDDKQSYVYGVIWCDSFLHLKAELGCYVNGTKHVFLQTDDVPIGFTFTLVAGVGGDPYRIQGLAANTTVFDYTDTNRVSLMGKNYRGWGFRSDATANAAPADAAFVGCADNAPIDLVGSGFRQYNSSTSTHNLDFSKISTSVLGGDYFPSNYFNVTQHCTKDITLGNNTATVSISGWYMVTVATRVNTFSVAAGMPTVMMILFKNGVLEMTSAGIGAGFNVIGFNNGTHYLSGAFLIYLQAGDTIKPAIGQVSGDITSAFSISGSADGVIAHWSAALVNRSLA